jgi:hypothetical protein
MVHLWSQTREIMVTATKKNIKFTIPLIYESNLIGAFNRVEKIGNNIVIHYDMKGEEVPQQFKDKREQYEKFAGFLAYPGERLQ